MIRRRRARPAVGLLLAGCLGLLTGRSAAGEIPATAPVLRGLVMPSQHATVSSRLQATILRIGPDNGEAFRKGELIVEFDCESYDAELRRAAAEVEAAEDTLRVKEELARSGSASKLQAVLARAEVKRARAELLVREKQVSQCVIEAPYDGRVVRRIANAHETVGFRDPLIEIVGDEGIELRVFVPSQWLRRLAPGGRFSFRIDETGEIAEAAIISVGAWIDNVSQLVEVRAEVLSKGLALTAGMSGAASFPDAVAEVAR